MVSLYFKRSVVITVILVNTPMPILVHYIISTYPRLSSAGREIQMILVNFNLLVTILCVNQNSRLKKSIMLFYNC